MPGTGIDGDELLGRERAARAHERSVVSEARRSASCAARGEGCDILGYRGGGFAARGVVRACVGGCEKAFGWGVNTGAATPSAVPSSSSSSSSSDEGDGKWMSCVMCRRGEMRPVGMFSVELVSRPSSQEEEDSSYSSWLLVLCWRAAWGMREVEEVGRRRVRRMCWDWMRRPVVMTSLSMEEREEEEGCEEISTQDSVGVVC